MPRVTLGPLSLDAPDGWTLTTIILAAPLDKSEPQDGVRSFQPNVVVTMEQVTADTEPDDYVRRQEEGLVGAGVENVTVGDSEDVSLGNRQWGRLDERIVVTPNGERVRQMQLVAVKSGEAEDSAAIAYTIIATHLDGPRFEALRSEFRELLLSFE